jgi:hypothetical protein
MISAGMVVKKGAIQSYAGRACNSPENAQPDRAKDGAIQAGFPFKVAV